MSRSELASTMFLTMFRDTALSLAGLHWQWEQSTCVGPFVRIVEHGLTGVLVGSCGTGVHECARATYMRLRWRVEEEKKERKRQARAAAQGKPGGGGP